MQGVSPPPKDQYYSSLARFLRRTDELDLVLRRTYVALRILRGRGNRAQWIGEVIDCQGG